MKSGRTITAEREHIQSSSERMSARKTAKRKRIISVAIAILIIVTILVLAITLWRHFAKEASAPVQTSPELAPTVQIVDESGANKVSTRVKEHVALLEQDFSEKGMTIDHVSLPAGTVREIYINLVGKGYYFKTTLDRGTAVTAEDASRMILYLEEKGITPAEYVDIRTPEKAYYK